MNRDKSQISKGREQINFDITMNCFCYVVQRKECFEFYSQSTTTSQDCDFIFITICNFYNTKELFLLLLRTPISPKTFRNELVTQPLQRSLFYKQSKLKLNKGKHVTQVQHPKHQTKFSQTAKDTSLDQTMRDSTIVSKPCIKLVQIFSIVKQG